MADLIFPKDFVFGTATAAYQIEGGVNEGGRGPSIWDEFSHRKGKTHLDQNGDVACDHYHRYPEDVALMRELQVNAYRMSLSWSRIIPEGTGAVNQKGLDYYKSLLELLLEANITPYVTLFHWDMPLKLHQRYGGFQSRQASLDFADYAQVVATELGDRVDHFITLNDYLSQVKRAMDEGANITGYFAWTLIDNFEWATGYSKRFGLIHVDHETQQRTIKNSGRWYADLIARSRTLGT